MKLTYIVTIATSLLVGTFAYADDMTIEMLNKREDGAKMVYSEDIANIDVGDTITWVPTSKGHNVQFIAGPRRLGSSKKSKNNKEVSITFDVPGLYVYVCTPHATMGMLGVVVADGGEVPLNDVSKAKVRGKSKKKLKELLKEFE